MFHSNRCSLFPFVVGVSTATLVLCSTFQIVHAVDKTWDNGGPNEFWDEDDNWDPNEKPQPDDKAIVGGGPEVNTLEIFGELENTGTIDITTGTLQPQGDTENSGTITIGDGSAILSQLIVAGGTTLSGSGEVILQNSDNLPGSNATLTGGSSAAAVNDAGHTIRGEGSITLYWQNDGSILAAETSGDSSAVLRLSNTTFLNNGEIRSASGASINLHNAAYSHGGSGQLFADTDSVTLTGQTSIAGGSLETIGGGVFDANGLITLSGVTVNAPIDNTNTSGPINDGRLYVDSAGITNNSTITLEGVSGRNSQFGFTAPGGMLDGTGEVVLAGGNNQTFIAVFPGISHPFTHGANHTIRGAGAIATTITNNGTIRAEPGTDGATLQFSGVQTNNSRIDAGAGATLLFTSTVFGASQITQGAGGVIAALDGGTVTLNGGSYTGGSFDTVGSGEVTLTNNPTLTDVTNRGTFNAPGGRQIRIAGSTFTNDGVVTLNSDGSNSIGILTYTEDITLDGAGEVVLQSAPGGTRVVPFAGAHTLTNGAGHTIRGNGFLSGTVVNQGKLEGNSAAEPLTIFANLSGDGPLENVQISASVFQGFSVHSPGTSTAVVPLTGNYEITFNATLAIELGGTTPGTEHDQLSSTGTVDIDGGLTVSLIDSGSAYTPTAGDRFDIITSANNDIVGAFRDAFVDLPEFALSHILSWEPIDYSDPRKVSLEIAAATPYDVDLDDDGDVDGADFLAIQRTDPSLIPAWEFEYGNSTGSVSSLTAAVPEPSTLILLCSVALTALPHSSLRQTIRQPPLYA